MKQEKSNKKPHEKSQSANNFPSDKRENNDYLTINVASFDVHVKTNPKLIDL